MKTPLRILLTAFTLSAFASLVHAGPGPQYWETQRQAAQFTQLKPGDKLAYVCLECKTVSDVPIQSKEQAMSMCKEGSMVMCPSCHMQMKAMMKPDQSGDAAAPSQVVYVNDKGEECGFFVKTNNGK